MGAKHVPSVPPGHAEVSEIWAVVLAGGAARRFGSDKLEAALGQHRLLERAVCELPTGSRLVVVGPVRDTLAADHPIMYVREDPPGGGPAAAMIAGLLAVTGHDAASTDDLVVVLPGDAPAAGAAASLLLAALRDDGLHSAVVGVDSLGRDQPLQLALRRSAVDRLITVAGPARAQDASARMLLAGLGDDLGRGALPDDLHADIDTHADLVRWLRNHRS